MPHFIVSFNGAPVQRNFLGHLLATTAMFSQLASPALAQWQVPNHSTPIGRGPGVTGFNSAAPGTAGNLLTSRGAGLDPNFQPPAGIASTYGASVFSNVATTCNGIADDTAGIQAVLSGGNAYVFIPPGFTCLVDGITIPASTSFQIAAGSTLKKFGTGVTKMVNIGGANVSLFGPGTIDANNITSLAVEHVFCNSQTGLTVDGLKFINGKYGNIHGVDCDKVTIRNSRFLGGDSTDGLGSVALFYTKASSDYTIENNYCDRLGSIATGGESCFDIVGNGNVLSRLKFIENTCIGVSVTTTVFQACIQTINTGTANGLSGAIISNNQARFCNYCFTFDTPTSSVVANNVARDVLSVGYTYEASGCVNSTFIGNTAEGKMEPPGAMLLINVSNGCTFTGNTFVNTSVDAAAGTIGMAPTATKGSKNVVSNNTIIISGGVGILASNDNSVISGNVISGGVNAINLTAGTGRTVIGNITVGQSGTPIINADATDVICGNNVLGCNAVTANSGVIEYRSTVNFNSANTDTAFTITLPPGVTRYQVTGVNISGASASLTTSTAGVFTAAAGAGVAVVTGASAVTVSTASDATNNNSQSMTVNNSGTESYTATTLYFRVATPQGSAATGTVTLRLIPVS